MAFVERILGPEAPTQTRDEVWIEPEGVWIPLPQRMAVCPLRWRRGDQRLPCRTLATVDALGRHLCTDHWAELWRCRGCGGLLDDGMGGWCTLACAGIPQATADAFGLDLHTRYLWFGKHGEQRKEEPR
jgi:hypothetical protein